MKQKKRVQNDQRQGDANKKALQSQSISENEEFSDKEEKDIQEINEETVLFQGGRKYQPRPCICCGEPHWLCQCPKFRTVLTKAKRWPLVNTQSRCPKCLAPGHGLEKCPARDDLCPLRCSGLESKGHHYSLCHLFNDPKDVKEGENLNQLLR